MAGPQEAVTIKPERAGDAATGQVALYAVGMRGGIGNWLLRMGSGFAELGQEVDIVVADAGGPLSSRIPEGVRLVDLRARRAALSVLPLASYMRRSKPRVLISAQNHGNLIAIMARFVARSDSMLIASVHGLTSASIGEAALIRRHIVNFLIRPAYRYRADAIVAVSSGVADDLASALGLERSKIRVIPSPVVSEALLLQSDQPISHPWFVAGAPQVVVAVGRLGVEKGFEDLIHAFSILRSKHSTRLLILGEGPLRSTLEKLIHQLHLADDVSMPGFETNPYPYMKRAALFVLASRREGLPTALIEAMALGTPVVSTDCQSGPREILESGKWGRLVPVGDRVSLANAMYQSLVAPGTDPTARGSQFSITEAVRAYAVLANIAHTPP